MTTPIHLRNETSLTREQRRHLRLVGLGARLASVARVAGPKPGGGEKGVMATRKHNVLPVHHRERSQNHVKMTSSRSAGSMLTTVGHSSWELCVPFGSASGDSPPHQFIIDSDKWATIRYKP